MRLAISDRHLEPENAKDQLKERSTTMMVVMIAAIEQKVQVHPVPFPRPTNV